MPRIIDNKRKQPATQSGGMRTRSSVKRQCLDSGGNSIQFNINKAGRISSEKSVRVSHSHKVNNNVLTSKGDSRPHKFTLRQGSRRLNTLSRCAAPKKNDEAVQVKVTKKAKKDSQRTVENARSSTSVETPVVPEFTELNPIEMAPLFSELSDKEHDSSDELNVFGSEDEDENEVELPTTPVKLVSYKFGEEEEEEEEEEDDGDDSEEEEEVPRFEYISTRKDSFDSQDSIPSLYSSSSSSPSGSLLSSPMLDISLDTVDIPVSHLDISSPKVHINSSEVDSMPDRRWPIENFDFSSSFSILVRENDLDKSKKAVEKEKINESVESCSNSSRHASPGSESPSKEPAAANSISTPIPSTSADSSDAKSSKTLQSRSDFQHQPQRQPQKQQQPPQQFPSQSQFHPYGPHFIPYGTYPMAHGPHGPIPMVPGPHFFLHYPPHMHPSMGLAPPVPQSFNQPVPTHTSVTVQSASQKATASASSVTDHEPTELDDFVDYNSADDECSLASIFSEQQSKIPLCGYRDRNNQPIFVAAPPRGTNGSRAIAAVLSSLSPSDPATNSTDKKKVLTAYYQQAMMAAQGLNRRSLMSGSAQQMFCGN